jgi:hypothetical protein
VGKQIHKEGETRMGSLYDEDFYGWARKNAALMRQGRLSEIDVEKIAEELEDMGGSKQRELDTRLGVLLAHLLKWKHQPPGTNSQQCTIKEQRRKIARLLRKNPSLRRELNETFLEAYGDAILISARETGMDADDFPSSCPWTIEQVMDDEFFPG